AGKEGGEHRPDAVDGQRHAGSGSRGRQGVSDAGTRCLQPPVRLIVEAVERGKAGRHGEWVAGEGPGLIDGSGRRDLLHEVSPASVRSDGEAATKHFPQAGEIRGHAVQFLRATAGDTKTGYDLI